MKTLSNDITLGAAATGMITDYIITTIYENGIGVFAGRSFRPEAGEFLYVNFNDFAVQNQSKDDYLKLNDDGTLTTVPLLDEHVGTYYTERRFNRGFVNTYRLHLRSDQVTSQSEPEEVLCGYDYENKDLRPSFVINSSDSSLCRIMAGCDWVYDHYEEIGRFKNLLLPHYPYKETDKYGIGLQLWAVGDGNAESYLNTKYGLRMCTGQEVSLGCPIFVSSNSTFITLKDFIDTAADWPSYYEDDNSSIYLKQYGTSGDEFGDWEESWTRYKGQLTIIKMGYEAYNTGGSLVLEGEYSIGSTTGKNMCKRYTENVQTAIDYNQIAAGNYMIYDTGWRPSEVAVDNAISQFKHDNTEPAYVTLTEQEISYGYGSVRLWPITTEQDISDTIPDKYFGTCPVAILDKCYSRYYLAWNDRYGDIMSQPFDGKIEYNENIDTKYISDYKLRKRVINKAVQPKWTLNSKWLSEDVFPMYEAIYTSPYLLLYDTEQDKAWNVILTDTNYKEKTFKTEKKLFNLEITVEANTKQQMIY